jgi:hypothetical protein
MQRDVALVNSGFEKVLAVHVVGLLTEIRNYDAADLIALIHADRMSYLRSLIEADCDEHFRPQTMELGDHADVSVRWDAPPKICMAMIFRHRGVELHYRLTLEAAEAAIEIDLLRFQDPVHDTGRQIGFLDAALGDARRQPKPAT